jgi:hypothetical protein
MIIYKDMNNKLHVFDSESVAMQKNQDPLLEIAVEIVINNYLGVVVDTQPLASGRFFFGINFREDTHEGKIFSKVQADFYQGLPIPNSHDVIKKIKRAYRPQVTP